MLNKIPIKLAQQAILLIISLVLIFHFLIVSGVIPFDIVWGGRLTSHEEMLQFEGFSIVMNVLILTVVLIKSEILKIKLPNRLIQIFLWFFTGLFALNTIGNLLSLNSLEAYIFTPVTLILTLLFARLASVKA